MSKITLQDVLPPSRRLKSSGLSGKQVSLKGQISKSARMDNKRNGDSKVMLWTIAVLSVFVLLFTVLSLFSQSTVTITPRSEIFEVKLNIVADKKGGIVFESKQINEEGKLSVKAGTEVELKKKASGTIVVYNNYSNSSQRLIKNTRFETSGGLIFRIPESIIVPGKKTVDGKILPGSVETLVYADEPGEKYNLELSDFTIPGFKGDPRYKAFYARSKTVMSGGFVGMTKKVSEADILSAEESIKADLRAKMVRQVIESLPKTQVVYQGGYLFEWKELPDEPDSDNSVFIRREGIMKYFVFDANSLTSTIASSSIKGYNGESVVISNLDSLIFNPKNVLDSNSFEKDSVGFSLSGRANFIWQFNEEKLKKRLAGLSLNSNNIQLIKEEFPGIVDIKAVIRPIWKRSFPINPDKINIKISGSEI